MRRLPALLAALAAPFTLACSVACSSHVAVPPPSIAPDSTPEGVPRASSAVPLPPRELATIALPITVSLAALEAQLGRALPPSDSLDRAECSALGGFVCHQYVYRRDTLALTMDGDRVSIFSRLRYRARVALPAVGGIGSCGYAPESMRRAEMRASTTVYWRVDWRLATRGTALAATLLDPCRMTALGVDATPLMKRVVDAQLGDLTRQVDSAVPALADLRRAADSLWRTMQQPLAVDSTNTAWLVMAPERVSVAPLTGVSGYLATGVVLTARPRVVFGARPEADTRPLPPLTLARPGGGLHVPVDVEIPFEELGRRALVALAPEAANEGMTVDSVRVWSAGDTAVVRVDVRGKVDGAFYLVGRFGYDSASRSVRIDDLRYTIDSRSTMTRIRTTLGAFTIRRAIADATGHGRLNVGEQLDAMRSQLTLALNRPLGNGAVLGGMVQDVRVVGLYTTPTSFVVRAVLEGDARLSMR
ncbi:MAG TPA: DUF4403 family protein [Gemmatimonadaceae bacterium]|nr:DUF4403 family protein [Gemmatimonadaceae bacterium]